MGVGIDIAAAIAALRRDLPHPAGPLRPGQGAGIDLLAFGNVEPEGHGAVDRQHVAVADAIAPPISDIRRAAKAGAVDEEIAPRPAVPPSSSRAVMSPVSGWRSTPCHLIVDEWRCPWPLSAATCPPAPDRSGRRGGTARRNTAALHHRQRGCGCRSAGAGTDASRPTLSPCADRIDVQRIVRQARHQMRVVDGAVIADGPSAASPVADAELDRGPGLAQEFLPRPDRSAAASGGTPPSCLRRRRWCRFSSISITVTRAGVAAAPGGIAQHHGGQPTGRAAPDDDDMRRGHMPQPALRCGTRAHSGSQSPCAASRSWVSAQIWSRSSSAPVCGSSIAAW